eukprot:4059375-Heterocapsa_arctica.AAC.1
MWNAHRKISQGRLDLRKVPPHQLRKEQEDVVPEVQPAHFGRVPRIWGRHAQCGTAAMVPIAQERGSVKAEGHHFGALQRGRQGIVGRAAQAGGLVSAQ